MSGILVVAEHRQGEIQGSTLELIKGASELKGELGGDVSVVVIAQDPQPMVDAVSVNGVDEIITVAAPSNEFQPDIYEAALKSLIDARSPSLVLAPHSVDAWGYAPALAVGGEYGFCTDALGIRAEGGEVIATRAAYKEKVFAELDFPGKSTVVLTVRSGTFDPAEGAASPTVNSADLPDVTPHSQHEKFIEPEETGDVDITQASFMLSVGRGVGEEDNIEQFSELAEACGATLGCSRPIADNGWLPKSRQVGQSGKTVAACKLYLAFGISGSVQHMAGMKHVENIIAVNTDPESSIFSIARYGVVGDMFEIAEELATHFE